MCCNLASQGQVNWKNGGFVPLPDMNGRSVGVLVCVYFRLFCSVLFFVCFVSNSFIRL